MASFEYKIERHYGNLSTSPKGWTKELNLISWNGNPPKMDIRDWAPNHEKMAKGVTLTRGEAERLERMLAQALKPASQRVPKPIPRETGFEAEVSGDSVFASNESPDDPVEPETEEDKTEEPVLGEEEPIPEAE